MDFNCYLINCLTRDHWQSMTIMWYTQILWCRACSELNAISTKMGTGNEVSKFKTLCIQVMALAHKQVPQWPCPVQKYFSNNHWCLGRWKPGSRTVGSSTS